MDGIAEFRITYRDGMYLVSIPNYDGGLVVTSHFHESSIAVKDAEIAELMDQVEFLNGHITNIRGALGCPDDTNTVEFSAFLRQSIAEQVQERLIRAIHDSDRYNVSVVQAIRTADLTDLQNLVAASTTPSSGDVRATDSAGWQSIETAPKDGDVLTWNGVTQVVAYMSNRTTRSFKSSHSHQSRLPRVTHWMPLPPDPATKEQQ